ncbi:hypothetical protein TPA0906_71630 [Streptomyces olivaceus]|nr:hypothetical protein TPA0906_71630 [Streptomyces olivaceus]
MWTNPSGYGQDEDPAHGGKAESLTGVRIHARPGRKAFDQPLGLDRRTAKGVGRSGAPVLLV